MTDDQFIPDFSGDDFANDKEVQQARADQKEYEQMIEDSLLLIRQQFNLEKASHINFKGFNMFRSLGATISYSMKSVDPHKELRVSTAWYTSSFPVPRNRNSGEDQYLFGHLTLANTYPATYIHPETLREKLEDLVLKRDVDFSASKKFSRKFQVLTQDKQRLNDLLQFKNLDELTVFSEMEMELSGNTALFRNSRKPISIKEASSFCDLTKVLLAIFD